MTITRRRPVFVGASVVDERENKFFNMVRAAS
jgi:hypothetical protein